MCLFILNWRTWVSPPHISYLHPIPNIVYGIHCGSYVQNGEFVLLVDISSVIVVNNVADLFTTSVNYPVVAVKGKFITHPAKQSTKAANLQIKYFSTIILPATNSRTGWKILSSTTETFKLGTHAFRGVKGFPFQNFSPSVFIVNVMNFDDGFHIFGLNVTFLPSPSLA